jgi:beta-1,4-mannosyl-glycoprotein beta-1,4-N-acetylglucosaminyltransferase
VESVETQTGFPKPLYFKENEHLFEQYRDKIIHVIINERHPEMDPWEREHFQRNNIALGLTHCEPTDIILISDLDEIPRSSVIAKIQEALPKNNEKIAPTTVKHKKNIAKKKIKKMDYPQGAIALEMPIYFFHLNRKTQTGETWGGGLWYGTVATTFSVFSKYDAQHFRDLRSIAPRIYNGGWHFTWMGGRDKVRQKMISVVEGRADGDQITNAEIDAWINGHPAVPIDDSFPRYIRINEAYLRAKGFIADY